MRHLCRSLILSLFCSALVFAGQSLSLTSAQLSISDPNQANSTPTRMEFAVHTFGAAPTFQSSLVSPNGVGVEVDLDTAGNLVVSDKRDTNSTGSVCIQSPSGYSVLLVRLQRDPVHNTFSCEFWNWDATLYTSQVLTLTAQNSWVSSGGGIGTTGQTNARIAFFRVLTSLVPLGSKPPTTYQNLSDTSLVTELKFDGNLTDSSPNGHNASTSGGSATYYATPNQTPVAFFKTMGAPSWANALSLRAGQPNQLDGSGYSYTMADNTATVNYFWQQLSGPTIANFSSRTAGQPTVTNLIFGDYLFQLTASDGANSVSYALDVGAVATDSNGVVVQANPLIDKIYGPMIAFGKHPWSYLDQKQQQMSDHWGKQYLGFGGTVALESDLTSYNGVPRLGTVYTSSDGSHFLGVGTNFLAVFCNGVVGPAITPALGAYIAPHVFKGTNVPYYNRPRIVASCNSDTDVTLRSDEWWDQAQITSPGVAWGTYGICDIATCGDWRNANNGPVSNVNYYDQPMTQYLFGYRSGLSAPFAYGDKMADWWIHAPVPASPRDYELTGIMMRASIRPPANTDLWTAIHTVMGYFDNSHTISDPREDGYTLLYYAVAALLDTPNQTTYLNWLVNAYNNIWGPQQQSDGSYYVTEFGGDGSHSFVATNGSNVMTVNTGTTPLPSSYCGEDVIATNTGTISIGSDKKTITGTGTTFSGTAGMVIALTGTYGGQPWTMLSQISSVASNTSLTLFNPWRGDYPTTITSWRIYSASVNHTGYYFQFFGKVDSAGNLPTPVVPDTDNWYTCSVTNNGTAITLDKPYTGDTSGGNIYRRITTNEYPGHSTQPYMLGIVSYAFNIAAKALATYDPVTAAKYTTSAGKIAQWLTTPNLGLDPTTNGSWYAWNTTTCKGISYPSFGCSGNSISQARDYAVELDGAFAEQYLRTQSPSDKTLFDTLFSDKYAVSGFTAPVAGDGTTVDLLVNPDYTKYWSQVFLLGAAAKWPAVRIGGLQPAITRTMPVSLQLPAGAASADITITAPSGAVTVTNCTSFPCSITADARQGDHMAQITYKSAGGAVLAKSAATAFTVQ